jgi:hypothetical protein
MAENEEVTNDHRVELLQLTLFSWTGEYVLMDRLVLASMSFEAAKADFQATQILGP